MNKHRRQTWFFYLFVLSLGLLNIFTITWFPEVWIDEVLFADPVINFVQGQGFSSTVWYTQNSHEFWASYPPLYQWLLIPWLKIFGVSMTSVRAIGVFYMALSSVVLWNTFSKTGLANKYSLKILFIATLWLGHGLSVIYREGRSDALTIFIAALVAYVFISNSKSGKGQAVGVGILSALPGIQLPPFIIIVLLFYAIVSGRKKDTLQFAIWYSMGVFAGLAGLFLFLYSQGVLYVFLTQTFASGAMITGELAQVIIYSDEASRARLSKLLAAYAGFYKLYLRDTSTVLLSLSLLLTTVYDYVKNTSSKTALQWLILYLIVPVCMLVLGKYPSYYTWMGYIILLAGIVFTALQGDKWIKFASIVIMIAACITGLPTDIIKTGRQGYINQQRVAIFVNENIAASDIVYGEHLVYYPCKKQARQFFATSYAGGRTFPQMPVDERHSITALLVYPQHLEAAYKKIGGNWEQVKPIEGTGIYLYRRKP